MRILKQDQPGSTIVDENYPFGGGKDNSSPTSEDGTLLNADLMNDRIGYSYAVLHDADIQPNGNTETISSSQFLDAIKILAKRAADLKLDLSGGTMNGNINMGDYTFGSSSIDGQVYINGEPAATKPYVDANAFPVGGLVNFASVSTDPHYKLCDGVDGRPNIPATTNPVSGQPRYNYFGDRVSHHNGCDGRSVMNFLHGDETARWDVMMERSINPVNVVIYKDLEKDFEKSFNPKGTVKSWCIGNTSINYNNKFEHQSLIVAVINKQIKAVTLSRSGLVLDSGGIGKDGIDGLTCVCVNGKSGYTTKYAYVANNLVFNRAGIRLGQWYERGNTINQTNARSDGQIASIVNDPVYTDVDSELENAIVTHNYGTISVALLPSGEPLASIALGAVDISSIKTLFVDEDLVFIGVVHNATATILTYNHQTKSLKNLFTLGGTIQGLQFYNYLNNELSLTVLHDNRPRSYRYSVHLNKLYAHIRVL